MAGARSAELGLGDELETPGVDRAAAVATDSVLAVRRSRERPLDGRERIDPVALGPLERLERRRRSMLGMGLPRPGELGLEALELAKQLVASRRDGALGNDALVLVPEVCAGGDIFSSRV
jgi:hypothetical protein